ncbi:MAG TPA: sugar phosphate isomerase/epimerase family protein [Methanomicrobiales archaeon]|nr:sugar phosphate isomerase/epimerase family protein [Methanomicrobiales archaeon]
MMRIAVSTMFFHEYPLAEGFDAIVEAGLDGIEFWVETPAFWLYGHPVGELRARIAEHPGFIPVNVHAPILDLNPCSVNPRVAQASLSYAAEAIGLAGRIGADVVTMHPGLRTAKRPPGAPEYERFERLVDLLREHASGERVRISIENMERAVNAILSRPEEVRELLDREPWLSFTLDVSHAMARSVEEVTRFIDLCGDRLANVHLSRSEGRRTHLPVEGSPRARVVLRALGNAGYAGPLTLEIEDRNFDHDLSLEEKVTILAREAAFIRSEIG